MLTPLKVYWDETGEMCVLVYNKHFSVYQISLKGSLDFIRMFEYSIIEGYFWERIFFFFTGTSIFTLIVLPSEPVIVELAAKNPVDSGFRVEFDIFQPGYIDSLEGTIVQLPAGQLKLLSVVNMCLYLLDSHNQLCVLPVTNLFLRFCMEVASQCFEASDDIYQCVDPSIRSYFDEVLKLYEIHPSQLTI